MDIEVGRQLFGFHKIPTFKLDSRLEDIVYLFCIDEDILLNNFRFDGGDGNDGVDGSEKVATSPEELNLRLAIYASNLSLLFLIF